MENNTLSQTIAGAVLLLAVIGAVVGLAWHGTLSGAEAFGALTTIITLGGGALAVHSGAKVGARAAGSSPTINVNGTPPQPPTV
jgi:hypothetical protein